MKIFRDFRSRVAIRVVLLGLSVAALVWMLSRSNMLFAAALTGLFIALQLFELYRFISQTNRKLTRFLESVRYSDFISGFANDNQLGSSFRDLNEAFNEVLEAFRKTRSEKEEHWQYLNTVVQQVRTGIISFDATGHISLINANARRFLGGGTMKNINELSSINPTLLAEIQAAVPGKSILLKSGQDLLLSIQATEMRIRGTSLKLVTLQDIQRELQQQEIEAWQNLTRVLRHEIMNSITPISSLTSTLREILDHDMTQQGTHFELKSEGAEDLREGLMTIESRSKGLIKFIDAYREYTSVPQPKMQTVSIASLIDKVSQLMRIDLATANIRLETSCNPDYLSVQADPELIEQVLINLVKNSREALSDTKNGVISIHGLYNGQFAVLEVTDNGPGIIPEALNRIFVPFFTTKKTGSGIGLSLSRQIMQMHQGNLTAESTPGVKTTFTMRF